MRALYFLLWRGVGNAKTTLRTTPAKMAPDHAGLSRIHSTVSQNTLAKVAPTTHLPCTGTRSL